MSGPGWVRVEVPRLPAWLPVRWRVAVGGAVGGVGEPIPAAPGDAAVEVDAALLAPCARATCRVTASVPVVAGRVTEIVLPGASWT